MRKNTFIFSFCLLSVIVARGFAAPQLSHPLTGGFFDSEYSAGIGPETAYFVVDFGGTPVVGGGIHGFVYHWNGTQTADNAMLAIDAAGSLDMQYDDFGASPATPNIFISTLTDAPDTDTPDFGTDGRFWDYFTGAYSGNNVAWTESLYGISGRDFSPPYDIKQALTDGGFYGFYASSDSHVPGAPVAMLKSGDFNLDGHVDASDVKAMTAALVDLNAYQHGANSQDATITADDLTQIGDLNGDHQITNADLQYLSNLLKAGGGSTSVPEPSAWLLVVCAAGGWLLIFGRRNGSRSRAAVSVV